MGFKSRAIVFALIIFSLFFRAYNVYAADSRSKDSLIQYVDVDADNDKIPDFKVLLYNTQPNIKYTVQNPVINNFQYMYSKTYKLLQYKNGKKTGYVDLTLKKLSDNRSCMFFIDYYSSAGNIKLKYDIKACTKKTKVDILNFSSQNGKYTMGKQTAPDRITLPNKVTYLESPERFVKLGQVISTKGLGSSVYEVYPYKAEYNLTKTKNEFNSEIILNSIAKREIRANWILSLDPMVDWNNNSAFNTMIKMDFESGTLFFSDGAYRENMSNYIPRSETVKTYFKNPAGLQVRACKWVLNKGSLFRTVGVYTMYAFADSIGEAGYIPTQPMSEWLQSDYNIKYNFYDTRFNSDTITSLIYIYKDYPDKYILGKINKYINFYKNYYRTKQYKIGSAIFVPDYMDSSGKNKINPTSLNHFIAETEVMFLHYQLTKDEESYSIATEMLNSINLTSTNWIRPNGDLWYRITPEGKFTTDDYPLVTYNDLVFFRQILRSVEGNIPPEIDKMYSSKEKWAKSHGFL
ncbi:MAG TPA: hypothetical protein VHP38_05890 [Ruminiclostridium sp.]|nr:hypothetical protein [Ruminiclostridium sp.]